MEKFGGDEGERTPDLNAASVALSQLSYVPGRVGGVPKGIRTPVAGVKGRCPRPTRRWGPINKQVIMKESYGMSIPFRRSSEKISSNDGRFRRCSK